jgi:hypothetical protein
MASPSTNIGAFLSEGAAEEVRLKAQAGRGNKTTRVVWESPSAVQTQHCLLVWCRIRPDLIRLCQITVPGCSRCSQFSRLWLNILKVWNNCLFVCLFANCSCVQLDLRQFSKEVMMECARCKGIAPPLTTALDGSHWAHPSSYTIEDANSLNQLHRRWSRL